MSLEKAIAHGKEHRKQYTKFSEMVDKTCRPHGGDPWALQNRMYRNRRFAEKAKYDFKELN